MTPRRLSYVPRIARSPLELGRSPGEPVTAYHALEGGWWLWSPCSACGGIALPLAEPYASPGPDDGWCPRCETHRRRLEPAGPDPTVWYDTWLEDWVVRIPCEGTREGALLPMEIRWFDAAWSEVIRAAADLAYG